MNGIIKHTNGAKLLQVISEQMYITRRRDLDKYAVIIPFSVNNDEMQSQMKHIEDDMAGIIIGLSRFIKRMINYDSFGMVCFLHKNVVLVAIQYNNEGSQCGCIDIYDLMSHMIRTDVRKYSDCPCSEYSHRCNSGIDKAFSARLPRNGSSPKHEDPLLINLTYTDPVIAGIESWIADHRPLVKFWLCLLILIIGWACWYYFTLDTRTELSLAPLLVASGMFILPVVYVFCRAWYSERRIVQQEAHL